MDKTVSDPNFAGMAVFTPVINGEVSASAAGGKGEGWIRGSGGFVSVRVLAGKRVQLREFKTWTGSWNRCLSMGCWVHLTLERD